MTGFIKDLRESMLPFDFVMLICGVILFVVFLALFISANRKGKRIVPLLWLLPFTIAMIGYPTIQKISFDGKTFALEKYTEKALKGEILTQEEESDLEKTTQDLGNRKNLPDDVRIEVAESFLILDQPEHAKEQLGKVEDNSIDIQQKKNQLQEKILFIEKSRDLIQDPDDAVARGYIEGSYERVVTDKLTIQQKKMVTEGLLNAQYYDKARDVYATIPESIKKKSDFTNLRGKVEQAMKADEVNNVAMAEHGKLPENNLGASSDVANTSGNPTSSGELTAPPSNFTTGSTSFPRDIASSHEQPSFSQSASGIVRPVQNFQHLNYDTFFAMSSIVDVDNFISKVKLGRNEGIPEELLPYFAASSIQRAKDFQSKHKYGIQDNIPKDHIGFFLASQLNNTKDYRTKAKTGEQYGIDDKLLGFFVLSKFDDPKDFRRKLKGAQWENLSDDLLGYFAASEFDSTKDFRKKLKEGQRLMQ